MRCRRSRSPARGARQVDSSVSVQLLEDIDAPLFRVDVLEAIPPYLQRYADEDEAW